MGLHTSYHVLYHGNVCQVMHCPLWYVDGEVCLNLGNIGFPMSSR